MLASTCRSNRLRGALSRGAVVAVLFTSCIAAQTRSDLPEDVLALARAKQKVSDELSRLTNYVCLQTAERWGRKSTDKPFKLMDTLRFDVRPDRR